MPSPTPSEAIKRAILAAQLRWSEGWSKFYGLDRDEQRKRQDLKPAIEDCVQAALSALLTESREELVEPLAKAIYNARTYGGYPKPAWGSNVPGHAEYDREQRRIAASAALDALASYLIES